MSFYVGNGVTDHNFYSLTNEFLSKIFSESIPSLLEFIPIYTVAKLAVPTNIIVEESSHNGDGMMNDTAEKIDGEHEIIDPNAMSNGNKGSMH